MLAPNTQLGIYRLVERIGAGGMGEVWKAEDTRLGRTVAIKILPQSVSTNEEATARLRREARMAAQLNHPNIATIHAIEEAGDRLFIVMEYVDGEPLTKLFRRGIAEADLCRIGRSVAEALAEAHAKGIVHRDIKPDNIIVSGARVKVLDFGIAKQIGGAIGSNAPTAPFLTQEGMVLGTIHYMSPEQALGKALDARSDIFSLGVVLYEGATRKLPFQGETITETMTQIIRDEPIDPARVNPSISPGMNAIIQRCMKKNREERYATATDLAHALDEQMGRASTALYTKPSAQKLPAAPPTVIEPAATKRRTWPWIAVAVLAVAIGTFAVVARRPKAVVAVAAPPKAATPAPAPALSPSTATVNVPAPKIEETPTTTAAAATVPPPTNTQPEAKPEPQPQPVQPQPQPQPQPAADARTHLRQGYAALFRRDFNQASNEFAGALSAAGQLTPREQAFVRLGAAIAAQDRVMATEIARAIHAQWPNDRELQRIHREFPDMFVIRKPEPLGRRRRF